MKEVDAAPDAEASHPEADQVPDAAPPFDPDATRVLKPVDARQVESGVAREAESDPLVGGVADAVQAGPAPEGAIWRPFPAPTGVLTGNLRLRGPFLLDALAAVASGEEDTFELPISLKLDSEQRGHLRQLFHGLEIAEMDRNAKSVRRLPGAARVRGAWLANDLDALYDTLRGWAALAEVAEGIQSPPARTEFALQCARSAAMMLGQGLYVDRHWLPGGYRPAADVIRRAILGALPIDPNLPRALSLETIIVDLLLRQLGVSPARSVRDWATLRASGIFDGFEFREGGSPGGGVKQVVVELSPGAWAKKIVDLAGVGGYRDVLWRGDARE